MKKQILIVLFVLLFMNAFSKEIKCTSIKFYGVPEDALFRVPITKENIVQRYSWFYECKTYYRFDIDEIEKYALPANYNGSIVIRIDFEIDGKIKTFCFNGEGVKPVKDKLKELIDF